MSRIWITGYRSYELGIFTKNDLKLKIIKQIIKQKINQYEENGLEWVISGGNLGIEQWTGEVVKEIQKENQETNIKNAVILPFANFGKFWNDENKNSFLNLINSADFKISISQSEYKSPIQFKNYQNFMLNHTDKALMIYDSEHKGKSEYDLNRIMEYNKINPQYDYEIIDFYELQELADELQYKEY
ncbi:SLOG family protein [Apilactobacillus sp. TMW 2.2459]|uniref:SLOG family protein n=1 Tax=Apilactobacillus xinyiensis TaxID=2841032 RepID=UPI00200C8DBF|nr:SLOG family protein [Apilactobacillus xinyiensis]MCL0311719.1 SLOG family protein [Apilactobacillus xinyiensis]